MSITIPLIEDEAHLLDYLQGQLHEDKDGRRGEFADALDMDVSYKGSRAQLEAVRITHVEIDSDGETVTVSYDVDYSIFNQCKDLDVNESIESVVTGHRTSEGWEFAEHEPLPTRSTLDEF